MRKEKLVISLMVMLILLVSLTVSAFATGEPTTITTITAGNTTSGNTVSATGNATTITPTTNGSVSIPANTGASSPTNATTIKPGNTNSATTSSYRNTASAANSNSSSSDLPYTGTSYGVVFVIVALVISAVYAYKKVSDYNM